MAMNDKCLLPRHALYYFAHDFYVLFSCLHFDAALVYFVSCSIQNYSHLMYCNSIGILAEDKTANVCGRVVSVFDSKVRVKRPGGRIPE